MYFTCVPPSVDRTAGGQIDTSARKILANENIYNQDMSVDATTAVEAVYRSDWGRIVAALIGLVGDFDLAEESAQDRGRWDRAQIAEALPLEPGSTSSPR